MESVKNALIELQCEMVAERTYINPNDISWFQYDILHFINIHKNISPSKLSLELGTSKSKLSKALKQLKKAGYILQTPSSNDGRELITSLTASGNEFLLNIYNNHEFLQKIAEDIFSKEEQKEFSKLAKRFSQALRNERIKKNG
jgi:MarR family transcriptional repressor of emrRAB